MKILKVIHGYPPRYNAGSEVYSQTLCHGLAHHNNVAVFTRQEDSFVEDYHLQVESDAHNPDIVLYVVNNPRLRDRYRADGIDTRFKDVLDRVCPDVVHIGHLNHLSTSLIEKIAHVGIPILYTLHDYWLMCPRGQFVQMFPENPTNVWAVCNGQEDTKCAHRCYARYFSGDPLQEEKDRHYWSDWVGRRMAHIRAMVDLVDLFIAPSRYLYHRFYREFGLPDHKLVYLDYGFDHARLNKRIRKAGEPFTFGYIGTHIPAKGVQLLLQAFAKIVGNAQLKIWGRERGYDTHTLQTMGVHLATESSPTHPNIHWMGEYDNHHIVKDVFNHVDAIVVPSIWVENSPLVIHEAQQVRVPVITANAGGMAEYVHDGVNGLLFDHRSAQSLAQQMQIFVDDPAYAKRLGARGYLYSDSGDVVGMDEHVGAIEKIYEQLIAQKRSVSIKSQGAGPWRITFDTNPDTCNLHCIMCEEHSPHSPLQKTRKAERRPHRLMPVDMIRRVVADAAPHGLKEIIPSTMGEPLLYNDFEQILDICREHGVKLNLTTNGTFPGLGALEWAKRIVPLASDVKISWNGATAETHENIMLGSRWDQVVENAKTLVAVRDAVAQDTGHRCRLTFQLTFLETNLRELPGIVRLAIEIGIDRVKGHHLWAHFDEIKDQSMRRNKDTIRRWNQIVREVEEAAKERLLPNGKQILLENFFPLNEDQQDDIAPGGQCPFLGKEAWVSAQGRFDPCCAPDAERRSLGEIGNLGDQGIMDIWQSDGYRTLLQTYRSYPLCKRCNMRKPLEVVQ